MSDPSPIAQLVQRQAEAWSSQNPDAVLADFAEDSLFVVADTRVRGKADIREFVEDFFKSGSKVEISIRRIVEGETQGAVEWHWREENPTTGETSEAEDAIIFALEAGQIVYWREYIHSLHN
ncbi:MAG: nuclear transport factor 2 family protein [Limnospira sp.]